VRSRTPLRIRNNLVDAQLAIAPRGLRVTGTNQRIGLRGEMTTLVGGPRARLPRKKTTSKVQKGIIRFDDPTRIAPHVDITADHRVRRYVQHARHGGRAAERTRPAAAGATTAASRAAGAAAVSGDPLHASAMPTT